MNNMLHFCEIIFVIVVIGLLFFVSVLHVSNCWPCVVSWSKSEEDILSGKHLTPMIPSHLLWCSRSRTIKTIFVVLQVGTEDGYINIFSITSDSLQYEKILDKQEGLSWFLFKFIAVFLFVL